MDSLRTAARLRAEVNETLRLSSSAIPATSTTEAAVETVPDPAADGHTFFANLLDGIRALFEAVLPRAEPAAAAGKAKAGAGGTEQILMPEWLPPATIAAANNGPQQPQQHHQKGSARKGNKKKARRKIPAQEPSANQFDPLQNEEPPEPVLDEELNDDTDEGKATASFLAKYSAYPSVDLEGDEAWFAVSCFLIEVNAVAGAVSTVWRRFKAGEIGLISATAATNAADILVGKMSAELELFYPNIKSWQHLEVIFMKRTTIARLLIRYGNVRKMSWWSAVEIVVLVKQGFCRG
ncbi:hypothetical protein DFJ73DRAFT_47328 [Zopfochytrium polystomum]|nr:hypothetical protein DFJ73DRAFT_47328 [Zopfochytrium polystomum]